MVGTCAVIFDDARQKVLLTRRADNGRWCLPGGRLERGESAAEGCIREVLEETRLNVKIVRLVGVYTTPNLVIEFKDGNRYQPIAMCFEASITSGELGLSDETTEFGWFTPQQAQSMDVVEHHAQRILDAAENASEAFIR